MSQSATSYQVIWTYSWDLTHSAWLYLRSFNMFGRIRVIYHIRHHCMQLRRFNMFNVYMYKYKQPIVEFIIHYEKMYFRVVLWETMTVTSDPRSWHIQKRNLEISAVIIITCIYMMLDVWYIIIWIIKIDHHDEIE